LRYPDDLVQSTIRQFIESKVSEDSHTQCSLCDAGYVGYTCRHLHQRIEEHKGSAIGNHLREQHDMEPEDIAQSFRILRKCQNKFDCLIFEMFFIQELKPTLNKQCDSIRAKLFV
ncbi:unnamed protein product, partial [Porites evermanni]